MTINRGEYYEDYVKNFAAEVEEKLITKTFVADFYNITKSVVTKMHEAYLLDKDTLEQKKIGLLLKKL